MTLPPLRERREDLQELATQFLRYAAQKLDKRVVDFEEEAWDALLDYSWPGNIRELENVIERAVVLTDSDLVRLVDLPRDLVEKSQALSGAGQSASHAKVSRDRRELLNEKVRTGSMTSPVRNEREILLEALQKCGGNKAQAAKLLGLARSTFFSKLKKYALQK